MTILFQKINNPVTNFQNFPKYHIFATNREARAPRISTKKFKTHTILSTSENTLTPLILLVDNDSTISSLLRENLRSEGYEVNCVATAEEALTQPLDTYSLVITEIDLSGEIDGLELLERIKDERLTAHIPVVFCTGRDGENDIITGLNAGADEYVTKPFSLREFIARIRSVLRRHRNFAPAGTLRTIEYRTLILNIDSRGLFIDGESVSLSPTEFTILSMLLRSRNKLFTREDIFAVAWPGEEMTNPRLVDVNISRLRKKLITYGHNIVNRSGLGYGFMDVV